jgi:two-component system chemotaxis response regulator CheY
MRILVVGDDVQVRHWCWLILESAGHEVFQARCRDEGLESALQERPDLILVDMGLPRINGLTFLGELRSRTETKTIPVVLVTTSAGEAQRLKAWFSDAVGYLTKPLHPARVAHAVTYVTARALRSA